MHPLSTFHVSLLVVPLKARVCLYMDMMVDSHNGHHWGSNDMRVKERSQGARSLECETSSSIRVVNSKLELSQLLFISVRQRELVKSSHWIWSIYLYRFYLVCALVSHTTMWPCDSWPVTSCVTWHDCDSLSNLWHHICMTYFPTLLWNNQKKRKEKEKENNLAMLAVLQYSLLFLS